MVVAIVFLAALSFPRLPLTGTAPQVPIKKPPLKKPIVPLPDLALTRFELWPASGATTNDRITVFIEITNRNAQPAQFKKGDAYVSMTLPGRSAPWVWTALTDLTISSAKPLTSGTTAFLPGEVKPGTYALSAIADPDNAVAESDETNNRTALSWTMTAAEKPDLVISDIYSQQVQVGSDICLNVVVSIKNAGQGKAYVPYQAILVECAELGRKIAADNEKNYGPGETDRIVFTLLNPPRERTLTFTVDPDDAVKESNEANNTRTFVARLK